MVEFLDSLFGDPFTDDAAPGERIDGIFRIMVTDVEIGERIDCLADMLEVSVGEHQYDALPWMLDIGISKSGLMIFGYGNQISRVTIGISELIVERMQQVCMNEFTLVAMTQTQFRKIHVYLFERCQLEPIESRFDLHRGESTMIPVSFRVIRSHDRYARMFQQV